MEDVKWLFRRGGLPILLLLIFVIAGVFCWACMYEDIYRISTGENLKTEDWKIPAEEYERIMLTYFPVSIEQLREYCRYDERSNSYEYEMIYASPYPPLWSSHLKTELSDTFPIL